MSDPVFRFGDTFDLIGCKVTLVAQAQGGDFFELSVDLPGGMTLRCKESQIAASNVQPMSLQEVRELDDTDTKAQMDEVAVAGREGRHARVLPGWKERFNVL